jgi:sugar phosphate permease
MIRSGESHGLTERWYRIIPIAFIMYTISFIDRTNISLALPHISQDLRLDPQQAGTIAGVFYWGYCVLQIPGGHLAKHWSAKNFISILLVVWGISAAGCGLAQNETQLLILRILLGVAEGGVFPAALILLSHWFSRAERARANALWLLSLPGAVILSSPISGWMLDNWNWRVMMVAEGALPILWLAVWLACMRDHPTEVKWLTESERKELSKTLREEGNDLDSSATAGYWRALIDPQALILIVVYFCFCAGQMGLVFWLPSAMEKMRSLTNFSAGVLYTIPFIVGATSLVAISRHSDRVRERRRHVGISMLVGGACLLAAVFFTSRSALIAFVFIALSGIGAYGPMAPFWTIPTETLPSKIVGSVMGLVNAVGNLGAWMSPIAVGYFAKRTGGYLLGFVFLGMITWMGAAFAFALNPTRSQGSLEIASPQEE